jgi:hypothetical protein
MQPGKRMADSSITKSGVVIASILWLTSAQAQTPPAYVQQRALNAESSMLGSVPTVWSGGALLAADFNGSDLPVIQRLDRNRVLEKVPFSLPESKSIRIEGLAGWPDGRLAVVGSAMHRRGKPWNYLARVASDRQSAVAKDLENFYPKLVVVAPDGSIWVMGSVREEKGTWLHNQLRHYDSTGKQIGSAPVAEATLDLTAGSVLRCSRNRIAWLSSTNQYLEVNLHGEFSFAMKGPPRDGVGWQVGMAMSANNEVVVTATRPGDWSVWRLNREGKEWLPLELRSSETIDSPMTVGFDDESLVAFLFWPGRRVGWFDRKK